MKNPSPRETRAPHLALEARPATRTRRGLAGRIGLLAAVVAGLVAGSVAAPAAADDATPLDYVALGDSYTSGIGASPYVSVSPLYPGELQPCYQASPGYADVLDTQDNIELTANAACAGWTATMVPLQVQVASAAGVLNADTDLVTITAGGNDVGFGNLIGACMLKPLEVCVAEVEAAEAVARAVVLPALTNAYAAIRAQAPNAKIVALGYPHLFSPEGLHGYITGDAAKVFNKGTDTLNKVIKEAAKKSPGTVYVKVTDEFDGHGVGVPGSWFFFDPADPFSGMSFHPNTTGYAQGYAEAIIDEAKIPALSN